jgi:hypothetical protein
LSWREIFIFQLNLNRHENQTEIHETLADVNKKFPQLLPKLSCVKNFLRFLPAQKTSRETFATLIFSGPIRVTTNEKKIGSAENYRGD